MDVKDRYIYTKWCWEHGIYVIVEPVGTGKKYRLIVQRPDAETNGIKLNYGTKLFNANPEGNDEKYVDAIDELYRGYYEKNFKQKPVAEQKLEHYGNGQ